ncbi:hypothetical protein [Bacillus ndiopicus]|uniref:hypothetical protein n=1 Tax=Bacillus ndiopicus TaxID=1347368 RepID=UPI0005A5D547|nr:hypothetical protein [Bacillus ndiopicus]
MKFNKIVFSSLIALSIVSTGMSYTSAHELQPVDEITPMSIPVNTWLAQPHHEYKKTSADITHVGYWDGGASPYYNVTFYDGIMTRSSIATYYTASFPTVYNLSGLTTRTWGTSLSVTNGGTGYANGSVKLYIY